MFPYLRNGRNYVILITQYGRMLPSPALSGRKRGHDGLHLHPSSLRHRSRITNLGVTILVLLLCFSFLFNLRQWLSASDEHQHIPITPTNIDSHEADQSSALLSTNEPVNAKRLIIVAGHAIWKGCLPERRLDDEDWVLEQYQKGLSSISTFFSHILKGAELVLADEDSILIYSGGQTRESSVSSEGESYLRLAIESNLFHNGFMPFERSTSEDYAMDSYQNLLFSIARYHELTGTYPESITVIGYEMKRRRFEELHIPAIRWPKDRFQYIGIDEQGDTTVQYKGEDENAFLPFSKDMYGCHDLLLAKRRHRNPSRRFPPYHISAPELTGLLNWCPGYQAGGYNAIYPGHLPW